MVSRKRRHSRSVSTRPGLIELTCTPSALPMSAIALVKATQAALTELPMVKGASGSLPPMPAIVTSEPRCALSSGQASRVSRTWAKNLSAKPSAQSASDSLKKSPRWVAPALLTRMSSRPKLASHRLDQRLFGALLAQIEHRDGGLAALGLDLGRDRVQRRLVPPGDAARSQPSSASDSAMPCPMPRLAPVTRATLPLNPSSIARPSLAVAPGSLPNDPSGQARGTGRARMAAINGFDGGITELRLAAPALDH